MSYKTSKHYDANKRPQQQRNDWDDDWFDNKWNKPQNRKDAYDNSWSGNRWNKNKPCQCSCAGCLYNKPCPAPKSCAPCRPCPAPKPCAPCKPCPAPKPCAPCKPCPPCQPCNFDCDYKPEPFVYYKHPKKAYRPSYLPSRRPCPDY